MHLSDSTDRTVVPIVGVLLALVACSEPSFAPGTSQPAAMTLTGFGAVRIRPDRITFSSLNGGPRHVRISQRSYSYGQFSYTTGGPYCQSNATGAFDDLNQRGEAIWSIYPVAQVAHGCSMKFFGAGNRKAKLFVNVK